MQKGGNHKIIKSQSTFVKRVQRKEWREASYGGLSHWFMPTESLLSQTVSKYDYRNSWRQQKKTKLEYNSQGSVVNSKFWTESENIQWGPNKRSRHVSDNQRVEENKWWGEEGYRLSLHNSFTLLLAFFLRELRNHMMQCQFLNWLHSLVHLSQSNVVFLAMKLERLHWDWSSCVIPRNGLKKISWYKPKLSRSYLASTFQSSSTEFVAIKLKQGAHVLLL